MPLKVERRKDTGTLWIVGTVTPAGQERGVRVRRRAGSDDIALAREEAAALQAQILRNVWHGEKAVSRGFGAAVISYMKHAERSPGTKALVHRLLLHFKTTPLDRIDQEAVDKARAAILRPNASPGTVRRNLIAPLRAILIHAAKRRWCQMPSFDLLAEPKGRTTFLLPAQVAALLDAAAPTVRPLFLFLVGTGCRLGEALALDWSDVDLQAGRAILWEGETKAGTRRLVHLPPAVTTAMGAIGRSEGRVFLTRHGVPYRLAQDGKGGGQVHRAWATACRKGSLPGEVFSRARPDRPSQALDFRPVFTPHHLRHTWATWHYALHRDLLKLKVEGGWSSTALVERYAHIMPVGHEDAICAIWGVWPSAQPMARGVNIS